MRSLSRSMLSRRRLMQIGGTGLAVGLIDGRMLPVTARAQADLSNQELRTIGLSVTVQDRILEDFEEKSGVGSTTGTAAIFPDASAKVLTGKGRDFDTYETIGERIPQLVDGDAIIPVPVSEIPNWQYARDLFNTPDPERFGEGRTDISRQIYETEERLALLMIPTVFNFDSVGYLPEAVEDEEANTWASIFDEKFKGKSALNIDPLIAMPNVAMAMNTLGLSQVENPGNLSDEQVDTAIDWLIEKKQGGQFRSLWGDFGELVNLMASKEVVIADAWQPAVMAIKAQGVDCKYAVPVEGYRAWSIGISVVKDTPNYDAALAYANYWLSGPPAITVSEQGYYSPVTTISDAMPEDQYNFWYEGKPWVGPEDRGIKEGDLRDGGSLAERSAAIGVWHQWPDNYDYVTERWDEFLNA
jgi:putative spermidine/putrescine transport system substrate-binding protein